jgi:tetratricopeptide (TPR) repeat protein
MIVCSVNNISAQNAAKKASPKHLTDIVTIQTEPLVLPTYEIGAPDTNPIFFTDRVYQGAQGHIYPYPLYDVLTDNKVEKKYNAVRLENKYVNLCVLPEIGGRILSATDKTNGYEFFYRQHVIKPALIGMLGAWMSGGVEWNIPHHHRPSSFMPIDHRMIENPDGSKTIWVGETELRHRLKWSVGLTLRPNSSLVEAKVKIMNRSPLIQSFLYWANVSVHCGEDYQVVFSPETQFGVGHSKTQFRRWPLDNGTDVSWWKNFRSPSSVFAWDFDNDFLAGYDHGKHSGTVHVANHHIVGGKKFFLWGNNPEAEMWDKMLTDTDGPYLELMVGAFSDNQPDYSWIYPGEIREFEQYWFPIRELKSVKYANKQGAVNLEKTAKDKVFFGFNTTSPHKNATVQLIADLENNKKQVLWVQTIDIDPATPFVKELTIPELIAETDMELMLFVPKGEEKDGEQPIERIFSYRPKDYPVIEEMPKPVESAKSAEEYKSIEELYLTGLRLEQFHNARIDPMIYYNEALKRDPDDSRVNTAVGIRLAKEARWEEAETHLRCAVERLSKNYTLPRDTEPNYYLGYVLQQQGKIKEAKDQYWKATWSTQYQSAAYLALAQITCFEFDKNDTILHESMPIALKLIDASLNVNSRNTKALAIKAKILGSQGKHNESLAILEQSLQIDPLDLWSAIEKERVVNWRLNKNRMAGNLLLQQELQNRGEGVVQLQELLEVALDYHTFGNFAASGIFSAMLGMNKEGQLSDSPLPYYYWAYFDPNRHDIDSIFRDAATKSADGVFPFRPEEIPIFENAIRLHPEQAAAYYYLGNLFYYLNQKEKGIENWKLAAERDPKFGAVLRNLGFAYTQKGDAKKAAEYYERSVELGVVTPRLLIDLDILSENSGKPVAERLALYQNWYETVMKHDDAVIRLLSMLNQSGQFEQAIDILQKRHFHVWEGGGQVHRYFVDAHLLNGIRKLKAKDYNAAMREFELADTYPDNLEVGRPSTNSHSAKVFYYLGMSYLGLNNADKAKASFQTAVADKSGGASELSYFRSMAYRELGNDAAAKKEIDQLAESVSKQTSSREVIDEHSKFGEDGSRSERLAQLQYLNGLVELAKGNRDKAKESFETAVKANPDLIWARQFSE